MCTNIDSSRAVAVVSTFDVRRAEARRTKGPCNTPKPQPDGQGALPTLLYNLDYLLEHSLDLCILQGRSLSSLTPAPSDPYTLLNMADEVIKHQIVVSLQATANISLSFRVPHPANSCSKHAVATTPISFLQFCQSSSLPTNLPTSSTRRLTLWAVVPCTLVHSMVPTRFWICCWIKRVWRSMEWRRERETRVCTRL